MADADLEQCQNCGQIGKIIFDQSTGDTICTECSAVIEARCAIAETSERHEELTSNEDEEPVRVVEPTEPLPSDGGPSTILAGASSSHMDGSLIQAFSEISDMADRLGIVAPVEERAKELYKRLIEKTKRKKKLEPIYVACLHQACKNANLGRTLKEILSATTGVTKKALSKAVTILDQQLGPEIQSVVSTKPSDFVNRFCSTLGLNNNTKRTILDRLDKCANIDLRHTSASVAAAVIYTATQVSEQKKAIGDIVEVTGVAESTIRSVSKEIQDKI